MKHAKFYIIAVVVALIIAALSECWHKPPVEERFTPITDHSQIKDTV